MNKKTVALLAAVFLLNTLGASATVQELESVDSSQGSVQHISLSTTTHLGVPDDDLDGNSHPQNGDGNGATACDIGAYEVTEVRPDNAVRLTTPPTKASDQNPAFSPDGSRLIFTRFENGYNTGPAGLFLLDLSNGQVTRLTPWEDQDNVNLPGSAWNALNGRIVFASDRLESDDLWRIAPDGADFKPITTHKGPPWYIEPSWSPDGRWIVFETDNNMPDDRQQGSIWKVRADGTGLTHLTDGPVGGTDDRQPNWSRAGGRILFQRRAFPGGQWDIYTMLPDGSDVLNVTNNTAEETDASWSPNGQWILFSTDIRGLPVPNIYAISVASGRRVRVTSSKTHEDGAPSWSPDGQWIAFESHEGQDENSPTALWRIGAPQSTRGQLTVYLPLIL